MVIVQNIQAIRSCYYLSHDIFFEMINNKFGQPSLYGSIKHKTEVELLTVNKM